jgi:MoaA/NifB/PqqE/SkfB family radical SAM enzyme
MMGLPRPAYVIFDVTSRCNAQCNFCSNWRWMQGQDAAQDLTAQECAWIFSKLRRLPQISLSGGEPLLREDLGAIIRAVCGATRVRFLTISTNGSLPERLEQTLAGALREFPRTEFTVNLSVDGVGEIHDAIRGVPGLFDKVCESAARLRRLKAGHANLKVYVNAVLQTGNVENMEDWFAFFARPEFAPDALSLSLARGDVREEQVKDVPLETASRIFRRIAQFPRAGLGLQGRLRQAVMVAANDCILTIMKEQRAPVPCTAGGSLVEIRPDGAVIACPTMADRVLGHLRSADYDLGAVLRSPQARAFRARVRMERCRCTWECAARINLALHLRAWPRIVGVLAASPR